MLQLAQPVLLSTARDEPQVVIASVSPLRKWEASSHVKPRMPGTGTAIDPVEASFKATVEALERFSSTEFTSTEVVRASADELGDQAVDLLRFPCCSDHEYADPMCPLRPARTDKKLRWVHSLSLTTGETKLLPLRAAFMTSPIGVGERFVHSISTGCAAHTDYIQAMLSALCEVIERDALALTWLQRLPHARINLSQEFLKGSKIWQLIERGAEDVRYLLYDATTDFGVPVIYGLRRSVKNKRLHTLVACASATRAEDACEKTLLELTSFAVWLRSKRDVPEKLIDFCNLHHGPVYMARKAQASAFDFLLNSVRRRTLSDINAASPISKDDSPALALRKIVDVLRRRRVDAYAVDLTTPEAAHHNLRVIRVVVPDLMPFSWIQRSRFLGHPRLYTAPAQMGYFVHSEPEINPYPQPFG